MNKTELAHARRADVVGFGKPRAKFRDTMHPFSEEFVLSFLSLSCVSRAFNENIVYWKSSNSKYHLFDRSELEIVERSRENSDESDCARACLARKPRFEDVDCMSFKLAADVGRHCERPQPVTRRPSRVMTGFDRLGAPRPTLSRVTTNDGRSPGSRVVALDHLPRANQLQWRIGPWLAAYSCGGSHGIAQIRAHRIPF